MRSLSIILALSLLLCTVCSNEHERRELRVYVHQFDLPIGYSRLQVYSTPWLRYLGNIPANGVGARGAPTPNRESIWISGEHSRDIQIVDTRVDEPVRRIPLGNPAGCGAFDPTGKYFLVCNSVVVTKRAAEPALSLVEVEAQEHVKQIPIGHEARDVCFNPDGSRAFTANIADDTISEIDMATHEVLRTVPTGQAPHGIRSDPEGRWLYVACVGTEREGGRDHGELLIHSLPDLQVLARARVGAHPSRATPTPDGKLLVVNQLWMRGEADARLYLIKVNSEGTDQDPRPVLEAWRELAVGRNPLSGDVSPDGRWFVVADFNSKKLSLIDLRKGELKNQVDMVQHPPGSFAVDAVFAWHGSSLVD